MRRRRRVVTAPRSGRRDHDIQLFNQKLREWEDHYNYHQSYAEPAAVFRGERRLITVPRSKDDFDLRALYDALDARRRDRRLSWAQVVREVNRFRTTRHPIAASTIAGLRHRSVAEGDGILQMLLWLDRSPESFVREIAGADAGRYRLPAVPPGQVLRWDTRGLFASLNAQRQDRQLTWAGLAREIGGFTPGMLTSLSKGGRVAMPRVMRLVRWLNCPAMTFTRISDW